MIPLLNSFGRGEEEEEVEDDKNYVLMSKLAILTEFNHVTLIALCRQRQERFCMSEGLYNDLCNLLILLKCLCVSHDVYRNNSI